MNVKISEGAAVGECVSGANCAVCWRVVQCVGVVLCAVCWCSAVCGVLV